MTFICVGFDVLQKTAEELKIETTVPSFSETLPFVYMNVLLLSVSKKANRKVSFTK